jgi:hypothetical protein
VEEREIEGGEIEWGSERGEWRREGVRVED